MKAFVEARMARLRPVNEIGLPIHEFHQNARHPDSVVQLICELNAAGQSYEKLSRQFGIGKSTIAGWIQGRRRGQAPDDWQPAQDPVPPGVRRWAER
jgi:transposase-like protein